MIKVKRLDEKAILPKKAKLNDSGFDLASIESVVFFPKSGPYKVKTGLAFEAPEGYELQVRPRSGQSLKGLTVTLGTVDNHYRGEVSIIINNFSNEAIEIKAGDRIAQIVPVRVDQMIIKEVDELSETDRGEGGFGSTGVSSIQDKTQIFI